jgi:uncharacterized protein YceK
MKLRAISVVFLFSSLLLAGCGTVANLWNSHPEQGGRTPFGGVHRDMACLKKAANGEPTLGAHSTRQPAQVAILLACAADLPLSLIGDVATWPYTAAFTFINEPVPATPMGLAPPAPAVPGAAAPIQSGDAMPQGEYLPRPRQTP